MSTQVSEEAKTVLDCLVEHLRGRAIPQDGDAGPAAILWTDPQGDWRPVLPLLRERMPELLTLGGYEPAERSGPAIWLRCVVDGTLEEPELPANRPPVIYMPGRTRQEFRAGDDCPVELRPLVELVYRGTFWLPGSLPDWGAFQFLTSANGIGLDISKAAATQSALLNALPEVAITPLGHLRGKHLQAPDFDRLLSDDPVRDILRWIQAPEATKKRLEGNKWTAFCNACEQEFRFSPAEGDPVLAARRMVREGGAWAKVWKRFEENPANYPEIPDVIRRARPGNILGAVPERWPDVNDKEEADLRTALEECLKLAAPDACKRVLELEERHGSRRNHVWAKLGLSPLALLLEPLAQLARTCLQPVGGTTPKDIAAAYVERGWQGDAAAWRALAQAPTAEVDFVAGIVRHLFLSWLDDSARAFQAAIEQAGAPGKDDQDRVEAPPNGCIVFVDGLRYDVAQVLAERLEGRGCRVTIRARWAALPTVTATGKPAVTPVSHVIQGGDLGEDFAPLLPGGKPVNAQGLRQAITDNGYQVLASGALDSPAMDDAKGWIESGDIDKLGHDLGGRLSRQLDEEIDRLVERAISVFDMGWTSLRIVTDHGWLMVPGGTPKVDLPKHLTMSRWARCATLKGAAAGDAIRIPWHWNEAQSFAAAPGVACFNKSEEYAHGGLSLQECLTPDILVERVTLAAAVAEISSVTWRSLRCFVECSGTGTGLQVDLRSESPRGKSVCASPKPISPDAPASLVLVDPDDAEKPLFLVLMDAEGNTLSYRETKVGVSS